MVGPWTRIEGTPFDPNPNKPFAKLDIEDLFLPNGRLSPSITIIGNRIDIICCLFLTRLTIVIIIITANFHCVSKSSPFFIFVITQSNVDQF